MNDRKVRVVVAGGFDPLHPGHCRHIKAAKKLGDKLIVIVNSDEDMIRKKGKCFQPLADRMEIMQSIKGVDQVIACIDTDGTCTETLRMVMPDIFAKGGDRSPDIKPIPTSEIEVCKELGIKIVYGVGGEKTHSSSEIIRRNT